MSFFSYVRHRQRWGFVVYRTDYSSETDWAKFKVMLDTWTMMMIENKLAEEVPQIHSWQQMWWFDDQSQFDNASIEQLRNHYNNPWSADMTPEQRESPWPEHLLFLVADKEVLDNVRPFHVDRAQNPPGESPFVKAFDKDCPTLGDDYPAWMKVRIPAIFYLYEVPLHLSINSMRGLRSRNTDWFKRDDCFFPEDTYADMKDDE
jgi:hypothetical protein